MISGGTAEFLLKNSEGWLHPSAGAGMWGLAESSGRFEYQTEIQLFFFFLRHSGQAAYKQTD